MIMIDNSHNLVPSVTPGRPTQRAIFHHKPYKTCSDHKLVYFLVIKPTIDRYPTMALIRSKNWPEVPRFVLHLFGLSQPLVDARQLLED